MKKLIRNTSDPEGAVFWAGVRKSADGIRKAAAWVKAGVDLNERHFVTYRPLLQCPNCGGSDIVPLFGAAADEPRLFCKTCRYYAREGDFHGIG